MEKESSAKLAYPRVWDAAVVVKDLDKAAKRMEALGIGQFVKGGGPPAGAEGLFYHGRPLTSGFKARLMRIGNMQLEFIQPDDKPNPWREFLDTHGEGIHHLGFQVKDVEKEVHRLTGLGAEVPFYGKINGKIGAAYIDLKIANLFIELTSFGDIP
jgi:methylmalonyl-CoA/ethylmalonyl-CoA epimerase